MHALDTLFPSISLLFQIVSNTVRTHALDTMFSFFSAVPNRFKYRQNARFRDIVFIFLLWLNLCVESLYNFKKKCFFFILANTAQYILVFFKVCFKMSQKCSCGDIGCQIFRGSMSPDPSRPMMPTH